MAEEIVNQGIITHKDPLLYSFFLNGFPICRGRCPRWDRRENIPAYLSKMNIERVHQGLTLATSWVCSATLLDVLLILEVFQTLGWLWRSSPTKRGGGEK